MTIWEGDKAVPHQLKEVDFATYQDSGAAVNVNLASGQGVGGTAQGDTLSGIEGVLGSKFNDTLVGDGGDNVFEGMKGADSLSGGAGSDTASYARSSAAVTIVLGQSAAGGDAQGDVLTSIENLTGSRFGDKLTGDAGVNTLSGGAGDDELDGKAGADTLAGGAGDDLYHADGLDKIIENPGNGFDEVQTFESLTLGAGSEVERLTAMGTSAITLKGNEFSNEIVGNAGANLLYGFGGSDVLRGGAGADTLDGGHSANPNGDKNNPTGPDKDVDIASYEGSSQAVQVTLGNGTIGTGGDAAGDRFYGIEGLIGSAFADNLVGDAFDNHFDGGLGADVINGAAGIDVVDYSASEAGVTVSLVTGAGIGGSAQGDALTAIEGLMGSSFADVLTGDAQANRLFGGDGDDILVGGAGADTLDGGAGVDTVDYSASTAGITLNLLTNAIAHGGTAEGDVLTDVEKIIGTGFNDNIVGSILAEKIFAGAGADTVDGGGGDDTLDGGLGIDLLSYASVKAGVTASLGLTTAQNTGGAGVDTLSGFENLTGSAFNDVLTGDANANTIVGGDGDDVINGGAGNDVLTGGNGFDTVSYAGATAAVTVNLSVKTAQNTGGAGTDTITGFEHVIGSDFNDVLTGDSAKNNMFGGLGDDTIKGNDADDTIDGGAGNDNLQGSNGGDTVSYASATSGVTFNLAVTTAQNTVGAGTDTVSGFENVTGSAFNDSLTGDASKNVVTGGAGNDTLNGAGNDDTLIGGAGDDTLVGGANKDTFVFAAGFGKDVIQDFTTGKFDTISFAAGLFDDFADVMASTTQVGADAIIALDANNTIKLVGVAKTALHDDDFRYV